MIGVLNTRPSPQSAELSRKLRAAGFNPVEVPLVELVIHDKILAEVEAAVPECDGFLLSSPTVFPALLSRVSGTLRRGFLGKPWYLVSAAAKNQVEAAGAVAAFVPRRASLAGFLEEFPHTPGLRLIHLGSESTRLDSESFRKRGITVRHFAVYTPQCPSGAAQEVENAWPKIAAVLFASGSAVHNLFSAAPIRAATLGQPGNPYPISIGPSSSSALRSHGVENFHEAVSPGDEGMVEAVHIVFPSNQNP